MNDKQIEKLMTLLLVTSAFVIMIGALLKLQHFSSGNIILWIGFITSFVLSSFEINRLKNIIKRLENKNPANPD